MTDIIPVFVNAVAVDVPRGTTVRGAVSAFDPGLADRLMSGAASVTDARGIPLSAEAEVTAGVILRVIVSARRASAGSGEVDE